MAREEIKARERGGKEIPFRFGNTCRGIIPRWWGREGDVSDRQSALERVREADDHEGSSSLPVPVKIATNPVHHPFKERELSKLWLLATDRSSP